MKDDSRRLLGEELARFNCRVHQPDDKPIMTREPRSAMQPVHWRRADLDVLLGRIGAEVTLDAGGQRRTLRLTNPGLPIGTTHTFWGSIQHILPGEVATAHRHAAHALRFIMRGSGATTTVDGERYAMNEGDLVLTPAGTWHDHQHDGDAPMTWLDGLDISLVNALHAMYFEPYPEAQQPVLPLQDRSLREYGSGLMAPAAGSVPRAGRRLLAYPWARSYAALEAYAGTEPDPYDDFLLEYRNPATGGPVLPTLGLALQWLRPGAHTRAHRHTGSVLYHVVRGEGASIIAGVRHDWGAGDFLALPPWALHEHLNASQREPAILFQINDFPTLRALELYREEAHPSTDGRQ